MAHISWQCWQSNATFAFSLTLNMQPQAEGQRVDPGCSHARKINLVSQKTEQSVQEVTGWSQLLYRFRNLNGKERGGWIRMKWQSTIAWGLAEAQLEKTHKQKRHLLSSLTHPTVPGPDLSQKCRNIYHLTSVHPIVKQDVHQVLWTGPVWDLDL